MRLKKIKNIQKYSGKEETPDEEKDINSKENEEKVEDAKEEKIEEVSEKVQVMQIDYDELPDGVYDFAGLAELQHRRTRPNLSENEKVLKAKNKKEKKKPERENLKQKNDLKKKNIVEEIFEEKRNNEEKKIIIEENAEVVIEKPESKPIGNNVVENKEPIKEKNEIVKEKIEVSKQQEEIKEEKKVLEENIESDIEKKIKQNEQQESFTIKITNWCDSSKKFAFNIMMFLGIITQISFLASSRENNLVGLVSIILCAISMFLLVNILDIKNKIVIFIVSIISVLVPVYNNFFVTGENSIINASMLTLVILSINLLFVEKNKIICFLLAVLTFILAYRNLEYSIYIILVIGIMRIIKDSFNREEKLFTFLLHCMMICVLLGIAIFL